MDAHERHAHQILSEIEADHRLSQRSLATILGIALGLTNLLVRRLVRKGWVRAIRIRPNRVGYLLTPAGIAKKTRMPRIFLQDSLRFYAGARDRVRVSLALISAQWPMTEEGTPLHKRIVFYGTGEVAEVAYICLQKTDLTLVGVVDETGR